MAKKIKSPTKSAYRKWKATKIGLRTGTYVCPVVPAGIITAINWSDWFAKSNSWHLGLGFSSLLVTVIVTIYGVAKRDQIMKEHISSLFYLSGLMAMWAVVLMFLASIANHFGIMLLYTAIGIVCGATCDQVDKSIVTEQVKFYKDLIEENALDARSRKRKEKIERAIKEAQHEAELRKRATE